MNEFRTMAELAKSLTQAKPSLSYCDYVAALIATGLKALDTEENKLLSSVGRPRFDLHPDGYLQSTTKRIEVEDRYGKRYLITVEEA